MAAAQLDDYQTAMEKNLTAMENNTYSLGTDPTHTQLAKDDFGKPLHTLAATLAIDAVREVGGIMKAIWENRMWMENLEEKIDDIFCHPAYSDWADQRVHEWAKGHAGAIRSASSPSIVLDNLLEGLEEAEKAFDDIREGNGKNVVRSMSENLNIDEAARAIKSRNRALYERIEKLRARQAANSK